MFRSMATLLRKSTWYPEQSCGFVADVGLVHRWYLLHGRAAVRADGGELDGHITAVRRDGAGEAETAHGSKDQARATSLLGDVEVGIFVAGSHERLDMRLTALLVGHY